MTPMPTSEFEPLLMTLMNIAKLHSHYWVKNNQLFVCIDVYLCAVSPDKGFKMAYEENPYTEINCKLWKEAHFLQISWDTEHSKLLVYSECSVSCPGFPALYVTGPCFVFFFHYIVDSYILSWVNCYSKSSHHNDIIFVLSSSSYP